ncbi:MAG: hypothetical protein V7L05_31810, partial [Nostoc sp.]|uniref:hypothetical protein n=1 Tax=Nostoc sp. TaxID=1180 RepID=UPI002FF8B223
MDIQKFYAIAELLYFNSDRIMSVIPFILDGSNRLKAIFKNQGRVILAIDGMQPEIGHEVLWVIR